MDHLGAILIPVVLFEIAVVAMLVIVYKVMAAEENDTRSREVGGSPHH